MELRQFRMMRRITDYFDFIKSELAITDGVTDSWWPCVKPICFLTYGDHWIAALQDGDQLTFWAFINQSEFESRSLSVVEQRIYDNIYN